jgi:membrane-bound lytic murein transglycosylase D
MKYSINLLLFFSFLSFFSLPQSNPSSKLNLDSLNNDRFINTIEQSIEAFYKDYVNQSSYTSIKSKLESEPNGIPDFLDETYCERLKNMSEMSPFKFDCNEHTLATIRFFAKNRRSFIKIVMGRSALYFDMYEEQLAKYNLPIELKYLSVIESGLRPQVKSKAGALGLWQFMYGTGKMFGLTENSYIDERMDPVKATDAACRYLKRLFDIYGDWNLALAAYNAGPGNVNKAIKRSGGKTTYWEVRPFLPRETQGYVPNFVAAAYLMTYFEEHNLVPAEAKIHYAQLDTICLQKGIHMQTIEELIDWSVDEIQTLNPIYKTTYIPFTENKQCISGPLSKVGKLVSLERQLYELEDEMYGKNVKLEEESIVQNQDLPEGNYKYTFFTHKVKSGETLYSIASKYSVSTKEIMNWNNLSSAKVTVGKVLKIGKKTTTEQSNDKLDSIGLIFYDSMVTIEHLVKRNESLTIIADKYNVTVDDIKKLNNLTNNWLNIDQVLKIETILKLSKPEFSDKKIDNSKAVPLKENTVHQKTTAEKPTYYVIKTGDLFGRIAQKHGLTTQQLKALNPSVNPDKISVGQKLRVK